jgi:hypothetical protein
MGRRHNRIWRQLRSARVSALTDEERRAELREAQERSSGRLSSPPPADVPHPPSSSAGAHAQESPGASAGPAGDSLGR